MLMMHSKASRVPYLRFFIQKLINYLHSYTAATYLINFIRMFHVLNKILTVTDMARIEKFFLTGILA